MDSVKKVTKKTNPVMWYYICEMLEEDHKEKTRDNLNAQMEWTKHELIRRCEQSPITTKNYPTNLDATNEEVTPQLIPSLFFIEEHC